MAFRSCFLSGFPIFSLICCILLSYQNCAKTFFCFIRTFKLFVLIDRRNASTFLHRLFLIFYRLHLPPSCWLIRFQKFLDFLRHSPLVLRDFGTVMSQFPHLQTRTLLYLLIPPPGSSSECACCFFELVILTPGQLTCIDLNGLPLLLPLFRSPNFCNCFNSSSTISPVHFSRLLIGIDCPETRMQEPYCPTGWRLSWPRMIFNIFDFLGFNNNISIVSGHLFRNSANFWAATHNVGAINFSTLDHQQSQLYRLPRGPISSPFSSCSDFLLAAVIG